MLKPPHAEPECWQDTVTDRQQDFFKSLCRPEFSKNSWFSHLLYSYICKNSASIKKQHHSDMIGGSFLTEQVHYSPLRKQSCDWKVTDGNPLLVYWHMLCFQSGQLLLSQGRGSPRRLWNHQSLGSCMVFNLRQQDHCVLFWGVFKLVTGTDFYTVGFCTIGCNFLCNLLTLTVRPDSINLGVNKKSQHCYFSRGITCNRAFKKQRCCRNIW